jgi:hypothetical protein
LNLQERKYTRTDSKYDTNFCPYQTKVVKQTKIMSPACFKYMPCIVHTTEGTFKEKESKK